MISELFEIPVTTVKGIIIRYQRLGHCTSGRHTGRPRATKVITDRAVVREVERNRFISASVLAAQPNEGLDVAVCPQTIRNRIKEAVLNGRSARKKPYHKKDQKRKRLAYAKKLPDNFVDAKDWESVLYTDEASVQLHGNSGNVSVWRRPHEAFHEKCTVPTSGRIASRP
uniref:PREDICTED: similar to predicted protein putative n=1 Tax=Albugo laibachii Nc14 TaxID=890382 RepID=F0WCF0_9STRA|nr:PREDICTED: similar to predicted protein putative [Albugo laibachii Nc14]|eukprot:CCA18865.1 PREDICTED: similar to predicted protein putative [Albugo laibachii Nc14]